MLSKYTLSQKDRVPFMNCTHSLRIAHARLFGQRWYPHLKERKKAQNPRFRFI